jgi:hypothetical protein
MEVIMKRKSIIIAAALAATVGAAALAFDTPSFAQPYNGGGWGMMGGYGPGPGMMGGYGPGYGPGRGPGPGYGPGPGMMGGYGPGWMHGGNGPGWMRGGNAPCWNNQTNAGPQGDLKLTADEVKARMQQWLTIRHNPRLKLGDVKEKDADTITADIVTVDNSLVQRFDINRHTGFTQPEEGN